MEVILLETMANLGGIGDRVSVKNGYARNYLLPQGKGVIANDANLEFFESKRHELEAAEAELIATAQERAKTLEALDLTLRVRTGDEGRLYGAISVREVVKLMQDLGVEVRPQDMQLIDGPARELGDYSVTVRCHTNVVVPLTLHVVAE